MFTQKTPKNTELFSCQKCDFTCSRKGEMARHILTLKHINVYKCLHQKKPALQKPYKCYCGKAYSYRQSLYVHKKKCQHFEDPLIDLEQPTEAQALELKNITNIMIEMVKNNSELQKQNQEFQKQMLEMCKNSNTIINNTSNSNSHNKTFNLQFFLNETCKDAMNMMDFVKSVNLQLSDLENVTKLGYVDGISGIIMKKLNEMEVHKRPIHCSDAKREILYVREDNIWEKEDENHTKLRKAIKGISKKNRILLNEWSESHPEANDIHNQMNLEYMMMIVQAMGGKGELVDNENKIIRKIMKNVIIDK